MNSEIGEPELLEVLSDFSCPKNPDVERVLKKSSIEFTKKNQLVTYLVFSAGEGGGISTQSLALPKVKSVVNDWT